MQARFIRNFLMLCFGIAIAPAVEAQHAARIYIEPDGWSMGMNVGMSDLWGDVGTKSPVVHYTNSKYFDKPAFVGGIFARYSVHPCFALKFKMNTGVLYTTDKWNYDLAKAATTQGQDGYQRYARGQNARDYIFEGSVLMEVNPFRFNPESAAAHKKGQIYFTAGIGIFHFTPYSTVAATNTYVPTYNLSVEGQGFGAGFPAKYSLWCPAVPLGVGWRWDLGQHINIGFEYLYRVTFTDYLDGVSGKYIDPTVFAKHLQASDAKKAIEVADKSYFLGLAQPNVAGNLRGDPTNKDGYSTFSFVLYYKLLSRHKEWWHQ